MCNLLIMIACACSIVAVQSYEVPNVQFELLENGFRVSIPDEDGIKNVAFNVNRNRAFKSFEPGENSIQLRQPTNGLWFYDIKCKLDNDDVLYIWTNVQYNQLIFRSMAQEIVVNKISVNKINSNSIANTEKTNIGKNNKNQCKHSITITQDRSTTFCSGQIIFEEDFNEGINLSRWNQESRFPLDSGDAEFVLYDMITEVQNGLLTIKAEIWNNDRPNTDLKHGHFELGSRCTGSQDRLMECSRTPNGLAQNILPPIVTARLNTIKSFNFKYGRIDIRAKLPQGDWLFPLLLLEPVKNRYGHAAYSSGELRIAFARGNENLRALTGDNINGSILYGGPVLSLNASERTKFMVFLDGDTHFGQNFHLYSLTWTDEKFILEVDGRVYGTINGNISSLVNSASSISWKTGGFMAPFDEEFYITLGLSAGGHGDFPDDCMSGTYVKPWANTSPRGAYLFWRERNKWKSSWTNPSLQVDYVRVYAI